MVNLYVCLCAWLIESEGFPAKNSPTIRLASALTIYRTNPEENRINIKSSLCCSPGPNLPKSRVGRPLWVSPMAVGEVARIPLCPGWL